MGVILLILLVCLYFLPTYLAYHRYQSNREAVFVINLFFGWTFIGWVIALAMSVSNA